MAKLSRGEIQLHKLCTQLFATIKGFCEQKFTGQIQFHLSMTEGGVSRANMITQSAFGYQEVELPQEEPAPPPPPQVPSYAGSHPAGGLHGPTLNLIATMSQKE